MRKTMKQLLALVLGASMVFLAGCGTTPSSTSETQKTSESAVVKESESTAVTETKEEGPIEITYPLTTDMEFTVWDQGYLRLNEEYSDQSQSPFHSGLAKNTGVNIKWTWPVAGSNATEAWNLLQTEKELPDIIMRAWTTTDGEALINDGAIWDLTEYLPKYAPDYWAMINDPKYENSLKGLTTESGKQYIMGFFPEEEASFTYTGPVVRKDWLDECGLDIPVTTEDWEEMLVAFKEKYNVTPFAMPKNHLTQSASPNIASATGAYAGMNAVYCVVDGKVEYANVLPEWKEYVTLMNKWYNEGLFDKDSVTMDDAAMRSKALNGEIGVAYTALSQLTAWNEDAKNEGTGAEWIGIGYPRTAVGEPTSMIRTKAAHWSSTGVAFSTALSEEELITALQWANYGYTQEGSMYWNFGEEGVSYTLNAAGEPEFTELVTGDVNGIASGLTKYTGESTGGISLQKTRFLVLKNGEVGGNAINTWIENSVGMSHALPTLSLTEDEQIIYKNLGQQIHTYTAETALKFMTGEEPLENFDAFVEKLNTMGLQQVLKIQQAAYERFLAK